MPTRKIKEFELSLRDYCIDNYKCPNCDSDKVHNVNAKVIQYGMDVPTIIKNKCPECKEQFHIKIIKETG